MQIVELNLQNFLCYKNATVTIPNNKKIILITGYDKDRNTSNGIGKSAILEAILFVLYGKTRTNSLKEIIRKGANSCKVSIKFILKNNKYKIIRTYSNHSTLKILENNKEIKFHTISQSQKFINNLLELDYNLFINFAVFDILRFTDILSLSSNDIRNIFRTVFDFEYLEEIYTDIKLKIESFEQSLSSLSNVRKHFYSKKREQILKQGLEKIQNDIIKNQKLNQELQSKIAVLSENIGKLSGIVNRDKAKMNWLLKNNTCPTCKQSLPNRAVLLTQFQQNIIENTNRIKDLEDDLLTTKNKIKNIQDINNKLTIKQVKLQKLLSNLMQSNDIDNIKEDFNKKLIERKQLLQYLILFESYLMNLLVSKLELVINQYISQLIDFKCKISYLHRSKLLTKNLSKFAIKLYRNDKEYMFYQLSSGEKMLVSYAFKLAINMLDFKDTFLFIDEGLNRLDENNKLKLLNLLKIAPFKQIFIVSNYKLQEEYIDHYIYIEKEENISKILNI